MINEEQLQRLIMKWTEGSESYRFEARRLELNDRSRHGTSSAMLEAHAQAIDQCSLELRTLTES